MEEVRRYCIALRVCVACVMDVCAVCAFVCCVGIEIDRTHTRESRRRLLHGVVCEYCGVEREWNQARGGTERQNRVSTVLCRQTQNAGA